MQHLAAKGWVCVAINYRLAPRDRWPAQIVDVKQAIAWIREHIADYGGDPDYIAITGGSAGGHLMLAGRADAERPGLAARLRGRRHLRAGAPCRTTASTTSPASAGVASVDLMRDQFLAQRVFAEPLRRRDPRPTRRATPLLRVTPDAPDFFVLHGAHDTLVARRPGPRARRAAARDVRSAPSSTPSSPAPSTPSTSSPRSAPPTSSARSTATCTGTGTSWRNARQHQTLGG